MKDDPLANAIFIPHEFFEWNGVCYNIDEAKRLVAGTPRDYAMVALTADLANLIIQDPVYGPDPYPEDPGNAQPEGTGVMIPKQVALGEHIHPDIPGIAIVTGRVGDEPEVLLIDGWKRAYRAWREGRREFRFFLLSPEATAHITMKNNPRLQLEALLQDLRRD